MSILERGHSIIFTIHFPTSCNKILMEQATLMNPVEQVVAITPGTAAATAAAPSIENVPTVMPPPGVYSNYSKQVNLFALGGGGGQTGPPVDLMRVAAEGSAPVKRTSNYVGVHWHRGASEYFLIENLCLPHVSCSMYRNITCRVSFSCIGTFRSP
jgi:hypothetical protein